MKGNTLHPQWGGMGVVLINRFQYAVYTEPQKILPGGGFSVCAVEYIRQLLSLHEDLRVLPFLTGKPFLTTTYTTVTKENVFKISPFLPLCVLLPSLLWRPETKILLAEDFL
jgi:hypothetical protein